MSGVSPLNQRRWAPLISLLITAVLAVVVMFFHLLPGLLALCLAHVLTLAVARQLRSAWAAALVMVAMALVLGVGVWQLVGVGGSVLAQYQALLQHMAHTVLEIRNKLPPDLAAHLPDGLESIQAAIAAYLQSQARELAGMGTAVLEGVLLAVVGWLVGALTVGTQAPATSKPLAVALRLRGRRFLAAFRQIVVAQFWIASFNASCTAVFLGLALPSFGVHMPYTVALVIFTFLAGLIPIVGNLLCNVVLTVVGVAVSPLVGLTCLVFLVVIHKAEILINAKVVGKQTRTATWELLVVLFVSEAVMGLQGLVAGPLLYAYLKRELHDTGWI
ncbi:AI-2E family transporter [Curvibacter sp. CHRR-16]|uniref:AI-2E family transporter n=1 Tax=Curvibacter sp. CHRR-16 TaxID=2835872 RepID=UPI0020239253|nr:AI-2E family transporter [Curvibacter sp. CHRR-16]